MIYKKRGRWEMVINSEISNSKRRRNHTPDHEELRRGKIRRKIEERMDELRLEKEDLW